MQELDYLRHEVNQRAIFSQEHYHKTFWYVITVWGGALTLFTTLAKHGACFVGIVFWFFILITIFFLSVVILYLSSRKLFEDLNGIHKIAAYHTVFYEQKPNLRKDRKNFWELAIFEMMKDGKGPLNWDSTGIIHKQHFILSLFAVCMETFFLIAPFIKSGKRIWCMDIIDLFMLVVCVFYIAVSIYLLPKIFKNSISNDKENLGLKKYYLRYFIDYAIKIGYYNEADVKNRLGEDFWNEVMFCKQE